MIRLSIPTMIGAVAISGLLALGGCETGPDTQESTVGFAMEASHSRILAGETVTLTTSSENTLGRSAEVRWHANGADLKTSDNGRVAQATFSRPGTYVVSADLMIDGNRVQTQSETIEVQPLNIPGKATGPDALKPQ